MGRHMDAYMKEDGGDQYDYECAMRADAADEDELAWDAFTTAWDNRVIRNNAWTVFKMAWRNLF